MWWKEVNQRYGMFQIGSPLFFHQNPVGFKNNIMTGIPELSVPSFTTINCPYYLSVSSVNNINLSQITGFSHWRWKSFFATMQVIEENSKVLEQETVKQSLCGLRKNRRKIE